MKPDKVTKAIVYSGYTKVAKEDYTNLIEEVKKATNCNVELFKKERLYLKFVYPDFETDDYHGTIFIARAGGQDIYSGISIAYIEDLADLLNKIRSKEKEVKGEL